MLDFHLIRIHMHGAPWHALLLSTLDVVVFEELVPGDEDSSSALAVGVGHWKCVLIAPVRHWDVCFASDVAPWERLCLIAKHQL